MHQAMVKGPVIVRPQPLKWQQQCASHIIYGVVKGMTKTLRFRCQDRTQGLVQHREEPIIFCVWHDRLALSMEIWRRYCRHGQSGLAAMVSASKDGGILARVLERFGVQPVRGSTSRRGRQALLELTTWAERGFDLAITPDGPRGPRHIVQPGVIYLAQLTGLRIVPVTFQLSRKWKLRSWDQFLVPMPFSRCSVVLGEPVNVARQADESELEKARVRLGELLGD